MSPLMIDSATNTARSQRATDAENDLLRLIKR
jgi:hypothetical protein